MSLMFLFSSRDFQEQMEHQGILVDLVVQVLLVSR